MSEDESINRMKESELIREITQPMIFISHDSRDGDLAEALSKLLRSVSAGMIKTFHSSDRKKDGGIEFGEEWYKRLMFQLQNTSDVICLFTERSVDRPWILFEAGVAKGKLDTPVIGLALGISLTRVSSGPFYQFMNMVDSVDDLSKLVHQLARRIPSLELDPDVVRSQVELFKATTSKILQLAPSAPAAIPSKAKAAEDSVAKLAEEIKSLPSRVAERLSTFVDTSDRRTVHRLHPKQIAECVRMYDTFGDPLGILIIAGILRDEIPWLYEVAIDTYRCIKKGDAKAILTARRSLRRDFRTLIRGPVTEFLEPLGNEAANYAIEFTRMLEYILSRAHQKAKEIENSSGIGAAV